jgi:hypothetical protein
MADICHCFDLCGLLDEHATEAGLQSLALLYQIRNTTIQTPASPWTGYFASVHGGSSKLPLYLSQIDQFQLNSHRWRAKHPLAHNPFKDCSYGQMHKQCAADACKAWDNELQSGEELQPMPLAKFSWPVATMGSSKGLHSDSLSIDLILRKRNLKDSNHNLAATQDQAGQFDQATIGETASGEPNAVAALPSLQPQTSSRPTEMDAIAALLGLLALYLLVETVVWFRRTRSSRASRAAIRRKDAPPNSVLPAKANGTVKGSKKSGMKSPKACQSKASGSRRSSYSPLAATSEQWTDAPDACSASGGTFAGVV